MYLLRNSLQGIFVLAITALILSACASPAILQNMIVTPQDIKAYLPSPNFENAITISKVDRNKKTNSILTSKIDEKSFQNALRASLKNNGLLAAHQPSSRFDLFVNLEAFEQPLFGKEFKVTSNIKYKVVERKTKVTWYEELVSASFITPYSDSGLPVGGMRLANEGAVRENIKEFITSLSKKSPPDTDEGAETISAPDPMSAIQRLHDLQEALDKGLIKNEEYVKERDKILDSL